MTGKTRKMWIETVPESEATGELAEVYRRNSDPKTGVVDHVMKIHSLHPQTMIDHENLYRTLMYSKGPLTRPQREMIAVMVSAINRCKY